jgi:hypothetical protein
LDRRGEALRLFIGLVGLSALLAFSCGSEAQTIVERGASKTCRLDSSGKLVYSRDRQGNRLPDFSYVGYHSGEKAIPDVAVRKTLEPADGDDTKRIQKAIDQLGALPADKNGVRGALLLKRGVYRVGGRLVLSHSGVVLRGAGSGPGGTVLVASGYGDMKCQRALITVSAERGNTEVHIRHGYRASEIRLKAASRQAIVDDYVAVGSRCFTVKSAIGYRVGNRIVVRRPATAEWIRSIGCDQLKPRWARFRNARWVKDGQAPGFYYQRLSSDSKYCILRKPGESWGAFEKRVPLSDDGKKLDFTRQWEPERYHFHFERRITAIEGNQVTVDAPIVHAMETKYGGGAIYRYETPGRVTEVGVENLRLVSQFAAPIPGHRYGDPRKAAQAEDHAWHGIQLGSNTENTWVRNITGNYFGWSLVSAAGKRATIQDCVSLGHASRIAGGRRYTFMINGQLNLVQRCLAYNGRHEFVTQQRTAGPNVFVDCLGVQTAALHGCGPHHRYSVGILFDNIKSERQMESGFYGNRGTGHGWGGAQICFYNCIAPSFAVKAPPGGICWVIGSGKAGKKQTRVGPASLYYQQVRDRLGEIPLDRLASKKHRENLGKYLWVNERLENERESKQSNQALQHRGASGPAAPMTRNVARPR